MVAFSGTWCVFVCVSYNFVGRRTPDLRKTSRWQLMIIILVGNSGLITGANVTLKTMRLELSRSTRILYIN